MTPVRGNDTRNTQYVSLYQGPVSVTKVSTLGGRLTTLSTLLLPQCLPSAVWEDGLQPSPPCSSPSAYLQAGAHRQPRLDVAHLLQTEVGELKLPVGPTRPQINYFISSEYHPIKSNHPTKPNTKTHDTSEETCTSNNYVHYGPQCMYVYCI